MESGVALHEASESQLRKSGFLSIPVLAEFAHSTLLQFTQLYKLTSDCHQCVQEKSRWRGVKPYEQTYKDTFLYMQEFAFILSVSCKRLVLVK